MLNDVWVLPCESFLVTSRRYSEGDWKACDKCARLINSNRWTDLLIRVLRMWDKQHDTPPPPIPMVRRLFNDVKKHSTGPIFKES